MTFAAGCCIHFHCLDSNLSRIQYIKISLGFKKAGTVVFVAAAATAAALQMLHVPSATAAAAFATS